MYALLNIIGYGYNSSLLRGNKKSFEEYCIKNGLNYTKIFNYIN